MYDNRESEESKQALQKSVELASISRIDLSMDLALDRAWSVEDLGP